MRPIKPTIIGSKTAVDFTAVGAIGIPAKVDTGADSSSVWASNIKEKDGVLTFRLFDRQSPFFDGKEISTKTYKTQWIKNSFGQTEFRYKVPMSIAIEGRRVRASFTLADRSRNSYPILIGRRTLKNKFLVDVSHAPGNKGALRVLVLVRVGNKKAREQFALLAQSLQGQAEIDIVRYDELAMVADNKETVMRVKPSGRDVASYGFIFFLTRIRDAEIAAMVAAYAKRHGIGFSDQAASLLATDTKAHQAMLLAGRVPVPRTIYMDRTAWPTSYNEVAEQLGTPFIFKDDRGMKGRHNFRITSKADFDKASQHAIQHELQMIAQTFIPNTGYYRLVVMGRDVVLAMFRSVDTSKSHTYSKPRDGAPQLIDIKNLPAKVLQMAVSASQVLSLEVAGVDILQDSQTNKWYCIEVNNSPQLVGGAFVEQKMHELGAFFMQESKK